MIGMAPLLNFDANDGLNTCILLQEGYKQVSLSCRLILKRLLMLKDQLLCLQQDLHT